MSLLRMPSLGAETERATLVAWHVRPGARVARGDIVAVVETAQGAIGIAAVESGTIVALFVPSGTALPPGAVLAEIAASPAQTTASTRRLATPAARRRAAALGIPLEQLRGTGVAGAICLADLGAASGAEAAAPEVAALAGREVPQCAFSETIDLTPGLERLAALNAGRGAAAQILPAALLLRAVALAVAEMPTLNGFWEYGRFRPGAGVHVGWAVPLRGGGLAVPVIRDADTLGLDALALTLADVLARPRDASPGAATITVTHQGEGAAESVLPVIRPPQVAMLGIGRIVARPWVVGAAVLPRWVVTMTLAVDHRAAEGAAGGRLLARIGRHLAQPASL